VNTCSTCDTELDYTGTVYQVDIQEWFLNKALGEKLSLCPGCGEKLRVFLGVVRT
jgi:hypothetical protein